MYFWAYVLPSTGFVDIPFVKLLFLTTTTTGFIIIIKTEIRDFRRLRPRSKIDRRWILQTQMNRIEIGGIFTVDVLRRTFHTIRQTVFRRLITLCRIDYFIDGIVVSDARFFYRKVIFVAWLFHRREIILVAKDLSSYSFRDDNTLSYTSNFFMDSIALYCFRLTVHSNNSSFLISTFLWSPLFLHVRVVSEHFNDCVSQTQESPYIDILSKFSPEWTVSSMWCRWVLRHVFVLQTHMPRISDAR